MGLVFMIFLGLVRDGTCELLGVPGTVSVTLTEPPQIVSVIFKGYIRVASITFTTYVMSIQQLYQHLHSFKPEKLM